MSDRQTRFLENALRGLLMGTADVVPGVSGGTVALIVGIYGRLVTAISHFDLTLLGLLKARRFRAAAAHVDLYFLSSLAVGIVTGVLTMTIVMNHLLTNALTRSLTFSAFFGVILASSVLVARMIRIQSVGHAAQCLVLGLGAGAAAWYLTTLKGLQADPDLWYIFVGGAVAICAMILPGISGAMILVLLGLYVHLTEVPRNLIAGRDVQSSAVIFVVFSAGCATGLLSFSKVLRWLLTRHHAHTMAVLGGFMVGSLPKLWPFQRDLTPDIEKIKHKQFELVWPANLDAQVIGAIVVALLAVLAVMAIDRFSFHTSESHDGKARSG